jgi:hypothetical protein
MLFILFFTAGILAFAASAESTLAPGRGTILSRSFSQAYEQNAGFLWGCVVAFAMLLIGSLFALWIGARFVSALAMWLAIALIAVGVFLYFRKKG